MYTLADDLKPTVRKYLRSAAKARSVMGMVRRNFKRLDKEEFLLTYRTYIVT